MLLKKKNSKLFPHYYLALWPLDGTAAIWMGFLFQLQKNVVWKWFRVSFLGSCTNRKYPALYVLTTMGFFSYEEETLQRWHNFLKIPVEKLVKAELGKSSSFKVCMLPISKWQENFICESQTHQQTHCITFITHLILLGFLKMIFSLETGCMNHVDTWLWT